MSSSNAGVSQPGMFEAATAEEEEEEQPVKVDEMDCLVSLSPPTLFPPPPTHKLIGSCLTCLKVWVASRNKARILSHDCPLKYGHANMVKKSLL